MSEPMPADTEFLKCDALGCDHFEMTPITLDAVDKPCPKCGANLCTRQDFIDFSVLRAGLRAMTGLALKANPDTPMTLMATNVHNGTVKRAANPIIGVNPFPNNSDGS